MTSSRARAARDLVAAVLDGPDVRACLSMSFQTGGMVVLDIAREVRSDLPVLFLDTGYHFAATYAFRDRIAVDWGLHLVNLEPDLTVAGQEDRFGILHETDPDRCCAMRKVEPMQRALEGYDVWITGLRRGQSHNRAGVRLVDTHVLAGGYALVKVNPIAAWTEEEVWDYLAVHGIPHLPLYDEGYTSIGCEPCTSVPLEPGNARSGRWGGRKSECGLHVSGAAAR